MEMRDVVARSWKGKRELDRLYPFTYFFYRPVSFPLTKLALEKGLSADVVTWISFVVLLLSIPFFLGGGIALQVVGVLLVIVWAILDTVDGNIARYNDKFTDYGHFIDTLAGYVAYVIIFFIPGLLVKPGALISPYTALLLSALSTVAFLFVRLLHQKYTNIFVKLDREAHHFEDVESRSGLVKVTYSNIATFNGFLPLFLSIAILTGFVELYVIFYFLINVAAAVFLTASMVMKAARNERHG